MILCRGAFLICLAIFLVAPLAAWGQETRKEADVVLSLQVDSPEILSCEPLRFTLSLVNRSLETHRIPFGWSAVTDILATPEQGVSFICGHPENYGKDILGESDLKTGMALYKPGTLLLFREKRDDPFVFRKPGRYRLKAQAEFKGKILESEEVEIFVKPVPQAEAEAFELFQQMPLARAMMEWEFAEKSAAQAAELIAAYPTSIYADHVRFFLGNYWRNKALGGAPAEKADAAEKACAMFNAVSPRLGALRAQALLMMVEMAQYRTPEWRNSPEYKRILEELEGYMFFVSAIGLEKEGR